MPQKNSPTFDSLQKLALRFQEWRKGHAPRSRLPEALWAAAVEVAGQRGLFRTARTLRLDYASLKKRVQGRRRPAAQTATAPAAFVELLAPAGSLGADSLIELENARGSRMRIQMKLTAAEAATLMRAWREAEA
jgi:hypothetical protein